MDYKKYIIDQVKFMTDHSKFQYWELMMIPTFIRDYYYNRIVENLQK